MAKTLSVNDHSIETSLSKTQCLFVLNNEWLWSSLIISGTKGMKLLYKFGLWRILSHSRWNWTHKGWANMIFLGDMPDPKRNESKWNNWYFLKQKCVTGDSLRNPSSECVLTPEWAGHQDAATVHADSPAHHKESSWVLRRHSFKRFHVVTSSNLYTSKIWCVFTLFTCLPIHSRGQWPTMLFRYSNWLNCNASWWKTQHMFHYSLFHFDLKSWRRPVCGS
jgi:hypothetical protein